MRGFGIKSVTNRKIFLYGEKNKMLNTYEINLYDYFKLNKPIGSDGVLQCYVPEITSEVNADRKMPVMLILPGGGYSVTCDREAEAVAFRYLAKGFVCFALRYSCSPLKYPIALTEACLAIEYICENAESLHSDREKISAVGFSAGGHLCCMLGSVGKNRDIKLPFDIKKLQVKATILCYPVILYDKLYANFGTFDNLCGDDEILKKRLSCEKLITSKSAPIFVFGTATDEIVNPLNALKIAESAAKKWVRFSIHIYGRGRHGVSTADNLVYRTDDENYFTPSAAEWVDLSVEWLKELGLTIDD